MANDSKHASFDLLNGAQIRQKLSGKRLASLPLPATTHEDFHADGRWRSWQGGRYARMHEGRWSIRANRLCVIESGETDCRTVSFARRAGWVRMPPPKSWNVGDAPTILVITGIK